MITCSKIEKQNDQIGLMGSVVQVLDSDDLNVVSELKLSKEKGKSIVSGQVALSARRSLFA